VRRHALLAHLHRLLEPRTYLEIGVRDGQSMALSTARSIGIDPFFAVTHELRCDLHLVRTTSDEFFARSQPLAHFDRPEIDLAFIDGMHLSEYVLRDFVNVERFSHPGTVIVLDDVLPRTSEEAGRTRQGAARHGSWAGDVYKTVEVLRRLRPDLVVLEVDTTPTGTAVLLLPDNRSRVLRDEYDALLPDLVRPDPQVVPDEVSRRTRALNSEDLVASPLWAEIRAARGKSDPEARAQVRRAVEAAAIEPTLTDGRGHAAPAASA
jgi:hypothetical protein